MPLQTYRRGSQPVEAMRGLFRGALFNAIGDRDALQSALSIVSRHVGAINASLIVDDRREGSESMYVAERPDAAVLAAYLPKLQDDPYYIAGTARPGVITATGAMLVPDRKYRRTRHYADFVRRVGHEHLAITCMSNLDYVVALVLYRPKGQDSFDAHTLALMRLLLPDVVKFARLQIQLAQVGMKEGDAKRMEITRAGLEHVGREVPHLLQDATSLRLVAGTLRISGTTGRMFAHAVEQCLCGCPPSVGALYAQSGDHKLLLHVRPKLRLGPNLNRSWSAVVDIEVISITDAALSRLTVTDGITAAEARLLRALVDGSSVAEYAMATQRSIHTIRNQLKSLMQRTGARRQTDLVRMALNGEIG